jgi:ribosomal protein L5
MKLYKVTINSVARRTEDVELIKKSFEGLTELTTNYIIAKKTKHLAKIRKGMKLGFTVSLYASKAKSYLRYFKPVLSETQITKYGSCSAGYSSYTSIPGAAYDLRVPAYGFSINLLVQRNGYGCTLRRRNPGRVKPVKSGEVAEYLRNVYNINVEN